jgi:nifR3 family TIM-barrel protein
MRFESGQHPVGIQLFGEDLEALSFAAKEVEAMGADFVDLNFGCPVPKVVKKGAGSAVLKDLIFLRDILRTVKGAVGIPVTIKVRTGWDSESRNTHEVAKIAYDEGITWVAIHGRTRAQGYSGQSDWDYIAEVKSKSPLPILGNGDILTAQQANDRLNSSGCDGVMIGRGCLKNPWIFREALQIYSGRNGLSAGALSSDELQSSRKKNFEKLFDRLSTHLQRTSEDRLRALQLKKLAAWYSAGYPESADFRKTIFTLQHPDEVIGHAKKYFQKLDSSAQSDTSGDGFLMGGHG